MVESVANLFLETLRDVLVEETKFLLSVSGEVEQVKGDLRSIHGLLMKADRERRHSSSPTLKYYIIQLKDLAYKAENVLETYAVKVESKKEGRSLQRYICIMCEFNSLHEVGKETEDIISRLSDLTNKLQSEFGQGSPSRSRHQQEQDLLRLEHAYEVEPHFVGMEKDIEALVSMVKDEARVVKICGMGGLGKTTLARKVYNHGDVLSYARAWVCITQQFDAKVVYSTIFKQLDDKAHNDRMDVNDLVRGIYRFLEQRKGLIVIDDIWENDDWVIIRRAFPKNCNMLLTTRNENIANQECQPYKLDFLTEDQGWDLLRKIALPQGETGLKSLEDIGREIVVKCGRLPLSISVIGGILRQKEGNLAEWKKVNMKMDSYLRHGEGVEEYRRVKQVLDLSYDALPYYLKPCFLYLACFPEDEEIKTERLYRLWMAEGFISYQDKGRNETLSDVAERYLTELAMRCMVQLHKSHRCSPRKKFDSCRLHDLMHDLCTSKAEQENFLKRIDGTTYQNDIPSSIGNSISRLAITVNGDATTLSVEGLEKLEDLRSFMLLGKGISIDFKDGTINFDSWQYLRILGLDACEFEGNKLPSKMDKLIHLRYLSLENSHVRKLPEFICGMQYLQSLDLRVSYPNGIRLPNVIWKMKRLRHLFLPYRIGVKGKLKLDGLDELETLENINSETGRIADIPKLISLRTLSVKVGDIDSLSTVANHMSRLCETRLHVESCDLRSDNGRVVFKNVLMSPSLVGLVVRNCNISGSFPYCKQGMCENLVDLNLINCKVGGDVMEELGKYPMLRTLWFEEAEEIEMTETLICRSNSFPQLESLGLHGLPDLKKWEVEERAMPKLNNLSIYSCSNLKKVPDGLRFISTLQQLDIFHMPKEFNERVRGQDYDSVSHITSIDIVD